MNRTVIETADGSHTLYVQELGERYHSIHGAIQESKHVFIQSGLKQFVPKTPEINPLNVLEIGFGTGLNALLTIIEADQSDINIQYTAIEAFPLERKLIEQLNYIALLNVLNYKTTFEHMHAAEWNRQVKLSDKFELLKMHTTFENAVFEPKYHLVYFDAFGPRVQAEMWTAELFSKLFDAMLLNSCLVTYCAQGEVKRTLKKVGFSVETIQGPPGKREMVRAWKK